MTLVTLTRMDSLDESEAAVFRAAHAGAFGFNPRIVSLRRRSAGGTSMTLRLPSLPSRDDDQMSEHVNYTTLYASMSRAIRERLPLLSPATITSRLDGKTELVVDFPNDKDLLQCARAQANETPIARAMVAVAACLLLVGCAFAIADVNHWW